LSALGLIILSLLFFGCKPPYTMEGPKSFKRFHDTREFKMITADGVMLRAREVDNYPKAALDFWVDAMKLHLVEQGYALKSTNCFKTENNRDACTLDFLLPHGVEDWAFSETIFVVDDTIVLVEVAGPYERYAKVEKELTAALMTFEPNLN
jgi:hypothetical protein